MTVGIPEPEGSGRDGGVSTTDSDGAAADVDPTDAAEPAPAAPAGPPRAPQPAQPARAPARRGRYAGVSDEERAEIESAIAELWRQFKDTGEERLRERLILHYSPLVKYVAGRVGVGLPPNIEQADLVSYGIFGLIDAIEKFDL